MKLPYELMVSLILVPVRNYRNQGWISADLYFCLKPVCFPKKPAGVSGMYRYTADKSYITVFPFNPGISPVRKDFCSSELFGDPHEESR